MNMDSVSHLFIRADATPAMGAGHVMRCLALAEAAKRSGHACTLATRSTVTWLTDRIAVSGLRHVPLPGALEPEESPERLLQDIAGWLDASGKPTAREGDAPGHTPWVVLDGYHFGPDCMRAVREAGYRLLVIDDYAHHKEYHCDLLLNQNIGSETMPYAGDIGLRLSGPAHVLLRSEFLAARPSIGSRTFTGAARRVLLTLGGGDFSGILPSLMPALNLADLDGCTLRIIAGATPHNVLTALAGTCPAKVEVITRAEDMPSLMAWADLCISAGGSTCWELCCLGVPFLTVGLAENQRRIVQGLEAAGVAPFHSASAFKALLRNPKERQRMSRTGWSLVDGLGADKIVARITGSSCILRPVSPEDREFVWNVANSPEVRAVSGSRASIPWEDHCTWFDRQLALPNPLFFIVCHVTGEPVGYVRFSLGADEAVISTALDAKWRNRGIGTKTIELGSRRLRAMHPALPIVALVRPDNDASLKAFTKAGFQLQSTSRGENGAMHRLILADTGKSETPTTGTHPK